MSSSNSINDGEVTESQVMYPHSVRTSSEVENAAPSVDTAFNLSGDATDIEAYLPLDVVVQILIRLPVSSILKCICICKQWHSLITGQEFITTHLSQKLNDSPSTVVIKQQCWMITTEFFTLYYDNESSCNLKKIPYPFNFKERIYKCCSIIGSVHGLLYLGRLYSNSFIWNPLIKRYLVVPESCIVIDKLDYNYTYAVMGFGFDSMRNDYKVVQIVFIQRLPKVSCSQVRVYSLKDSLWREVDASEVSPYVVPFEHRPSYFTNGAVHWIAKLGIETSILSFDMNCERFIRIDLPLDLIEVGHHRLQISETKGLLSIIHNKIEEDSMVEICTWLCDIWVQKEYNMENSWTKICNIDVKVPMRVLKLKENGEVLIVSHPYGKQNGEALASFDPKTKEIKTIEKHFGSYPFHLETYGEDLFSLETVNGGTISYVESLLLLDNASGAISYVEHENDFTDASKSNIDKGRGEDSSSICK